MNGVAVAVAEHLDFDVAGIDDGALQDHGGIAERALRLRPRAAQRIRKCRGVRDQPHAAPAATGDRLDHDGKADLFGLRQHHGVALVGALIAGHARHAGLLHDVLGAGLVAHRPDRLRRRPDEDQPGIAAGLRKILVLGEEAIARMHRAGAAGFCRGDDRIDPQIGLRRQRFADPHRLIRLAHMQRVAIGIGIDRDHAIAEPARGAHDPQRDLAAVGDRES